LKPPISKMAWMLGDWTCATVNWNIRKPQPTHHTENFHAIADPSGLTIRYRGESRTPDFSGQGRVTWDPRSSKYLNLMISSSSGTRIRSAGSAQSTGVTALKTAFAGLLQLSYSTGRVYEIPYRATTSSTGVNSFIQVTDFWIWGSWGKMRSTNSCVRLDAPH
jgi:hypothetical protein